MLMQERKHILLEMPLGMTAAAILDVATISLVSEFPESLAHGLTFLTCYKYP
jgi:hypothetical protein